MFGSSPYGGSTTPRIDPGNISPDKNDRPQQSKTPEAEFDCDTESVGQMLDRMGFEAYENGNTASWIGLGFLNAAYKFFTPGGDRLSQLNARAWGGEAISAGELIGTGLLAGAHLGSIYGTATGIQTISNSRVFGTAVHNSSISSMFRPGSWLNSGANRIGWSKGPESFQNFRLVINGNKIDILKSGVKNGVKCGPKTK